MLASCVGHYSDPRQVGCNVHILGLITVKPARSLKSSILKLQESMLSQQFGNLLCLPWH